jgi:hypothetical protein
MRSKSPTGGRLFYPKKHTLKKLSFTTILQMKLLRMAILTLLTAALATSCWKTDEDWSLCGVDNNLVLKFNLRGVPNAEFDKYIGTVDVFLFDADFLFLETRQVSTPMADDTHGTSFTIEPGIYYAVCWGNIGNRSLRPGLDRHNNFENSRIEAGSDDSSDPVFYAPYKIPSFPAATRAEEDYTIYEIVVPSGEQVIHEMEFVKAHREVEVFISRYEGLELYDGEPPVVERSGARRSYDFLLHADPAPHTMRRPSTASGRPDATLSTSFFSALTPLQGDGWVRLFHPTTGQMLAEINIADYVQRNNITDDSYIPIHFIFDMDANVTVTLPAWNNNDITPGK